MGIICTIPAINDDHLPIGNISYRFHVVPILEHGEVRNYGGHNDHNELRGNGNGPGELLYHPLPLMATVNFDGHLDLGGLEELVEDFEDDEEDYGYD